MMNKINVIKSFRIINLITFTFVIITLLNQTKSEEIVNGKLSSLVLHRNSHNSTESKKTLVTPKWWESIFSNVWQWLTDNNDRQHESSKMQIEGKSEISEPRTFGKIKRLQFALLPIMFKFGVLSTLISALVFLALKTLFLLKALFIVNLAVVFGKFFAWKTELTKSHHSGGHGGGGWGSGWWGPPPPPIWSSPHTFMHSPPAVIHSSPIIESPDPPSSGNKEIHVHVHTNKEEKEHHGWEPHPPHIINDIYGSSSKKQYATESLRGKRNNELSSNDSKPRGFAPKPKTQNHENSHLLSNQQIDITTTRSVLRDQKPVVTAQKLINSGKKSIGFRQKFVNPAMGRTQKQKKTKQMNIRPIPLNSRGVFANNNNSNNKSKKKF